MPRWYELSKRRLARQENELPLLDAYDALLCEDRQALPAGIWHHKLPMTNLAKIQPTQRL